jgi:2-dehydropantoate 2-reductase
MRFVVVGAGGIGGTVGARLAQHGHDVVLVARGEHLAAMQRSGLRIQSPDDDAVVRVPCAGAVADIDWTEDDVAMLAMKSHDTEPVLDELAAVAGPRTPVVCVQNGVDNERRALRFFERVYGVCVMCPTSFLEPGLVQVHSAPISGLLDIGRYPDGVDEIATEIAGALGASTFDSNPLADVMRWKYAKLLMNLGNAIEAICGPGGRGGDLYAAARAEGEDCLHAAGIAFASPEEDAARRGDRLRMRPIGGQRRGGGSTWQSLRRGSGSVETDHLNGEIALLGRLHGVPTPVNAALQWLAAQLARDGAPPGSLTEEQLTEHLGRQTWSTR